ncbi:MAG: hypothetical protein WGN25_01085 [Candidatus Electrothrix sp. GW3-4]|uniref:hypothetical protein n=1 Tax=Candidatus Electrothrix sp. GW3-4 TaxID=3126740 RepID=UPI0030D091DF
MKKGSKKESRVFDVCVLFFFGLFTVALTSVLFYVYPVSILTCEYVEPNQVDCHLQERAVGLIPIKSQDVLDLKDAYVSKESSEKRRSGKTERLVTDRVVLQTSSDTIPLNSFDETGGFLAKNTAKTIKDFLQSHTTEPLRVWQATWLPLGLSLFFFPLGLLMLYVALDILLCRRKR